MARQLKGKEQKESAAEKRARRERNREAAAAAEKYVLPGLGAVFAVIVAIVFWYAR